MEKTGDSNYPYNGNLTWLRERTILLAVHGSHAYGTSLPTSDTDLKGVAVPPRSYFLGFADRFEQAESHDPDMVIYDVRKFCALAADCNPNIIEVLWSDESDYRLLTPGGRLLVEHRADFLSKKARHTFAGYAHAQLKRIRTHYRWLTNPPASPPTRADMGLPERTVIPADQLMAAQAAITKRLDQWNTNFLDGLDPATRIEVMAKMTEVLTEIGVNSDSQWSNAARSVGYDANFIRLLDLERQYGCRHKEWDQYQNWKATRNAARADLESKHGYDTKHGMHLVRLMRMCREILTLGRVIVKRPDRDELLAIRAGEWPYERLVEWAEREDRAMEDLYKSSTLPKCPDRAALDRLCITIVESMQ